MSQITSHELGNNRDNGKTQYFHLVAPLSQQRQPISLITKSASTSTLYPSFYEILFGEPTNWVWPTFARPGEAPHHPSSKQAIRPLSSVSALEALPNELLYHIIDCVCSNRDLIAFGLSSAHLWPLVLDNIQALYSKPHLTSSWAGKKIALTGTWITSVPRPFLVNDGHGSIADLDKILFGLITTHKGAAKQFNLDAYRLWETPSGFMQKRQIECQAALAEFLPHISTARRCELEKEFDFMSRYPQDRSWILRNLTTREYVTAAALKEKNLSFHHVLISKISYIAGNYFGTYALLNTLCGAWAGHRFDIVTQEDHDREWMASVEPKGWTDVSDEVGEWTAGIRRSTLYHLKEGIFPCGHEEYDRCRCKRRALNVA